MNCLTSAAAAGSVSGLFRILFGVQFGSFSPNAFYHEGNASSGMPPGVLGRSLDHGGTFSGSVPGSFWVRFGFQFWRFSPNAFYHEKMPPARSAIHDFQCSLSRFTTLYLGYSVVLAIHSMQFLALAPFSFQWRIGGHTLVTRGISMLPSMYHVLLRSIYCFIS